MDLSIVPPFPDVEIQKYQFKWIQQDDQIELFKLFDDPDKPFVAFLMLQGIRPGEARALKCKNVDLKNQTITINATFSGNVYREKRKGKRANTLTIPIHPEIYNYIYEREKNSHPEAYLFVNQRNGMYYSESKIKRMWHRVRDKAGLPKSLRLYDVTRHSFASNLVNSGTSLYTVSKLLGHSSTKMTEKYAHPNIKNLRENIQKISLHGVQMVYNNIIDLKKDRNVK